jgi:hypothetical protein
MDDTPMTEEEIQKKVEEFRSWLLKLSEEEMTKLVNDFAVDLRNRCIDQVIAEENKGINWMICVIRSYNREWNRKSEEWPFLRKDGFAAYMKSILTTKDTPADLEAALNYL